MGVADDVIGDLVADGGPMIGLHTALQDCSAPYLLLVACDQPFLTAAVLEQLANRRTEADAIVYLSVSGRIDPFPSLMRSATMRRVVDERIGANDRSLMSIFARPAPMSIATIEASSAERAALRDVDFVGDAQ
jgi:molybdopterin-guanine dinucleotide biosynthesis protein A